MPCSDRQAIRMLCTTASTEKPKKEIVGTTILCSDALVFRLAGDQNRHDEIATKAALEVATGYHVLVLAHASLAHLAAALESQTRRPMLANPALCVAALAR
jgi:hypothetical protein